MQLCTSAFFCGCASNSQDSPKASPRAIFKRKNFIEPLKVLSQWKKCGEGFMPACANMCHYMPTWANIAVCQLCRERQPLWNSHDGLNDTCFINAMVFVPMSLHPEGDLCRFACRHHRYQCFSVVAQATAKIRPSPAQGLLKRLW